MDAAKIISFVSGNEVPTENELKALFALRKEFPYFQAVSFLCAKYDYTAKNISKAALATSVRSSLQKRLDRGYHIGASEQDSSPVAIRPNETGLNAFEKLSAQPAAAKPKVKGLDDDDELLEFEPIKQTESSDAYFSKSDDDLALRPEAATSQSPANALPLPSEQIIEETVGNIGESIPTEAKPDTLLGSVDGFQSEIVASEESMGLDLEAQESEMSVVDESEELRKQLQATLSQLQESVKASDEHDVKYAEEPGLSGDLADSYGGKAKDNIASVSDLGHNNDGYKTLNDLDKLLQNTSGADLKTSDFFESLNIGQQGSGNFFEEFEGLGTPKKSGTGNFFDDFDDTPSKKDGKKTGQDGIIDKFIEEKPTIKFEKPKHVSYDDESDPEVEDLAVPSTTPNFKKVTESLAKIYEAQGDYPKAIEIYEQLSLEFPNKKPYFAGCIKKLKNQI